MPKAAVSHSARSLSKKFLKKKAVKHARKQLLPSYKRPKVNQDGRHYVKYEFKLHPRLPMNTTDDVDRIVAKARRLHAKVKNRHKKLEAQYVSIGIIRHGGRAGQTKAKDWIGTVAHTRDPDSTDAMFKELTHNPDDDRVQKLYAYVLEGEYPDQLSDVAEEERVAYSIVIAFIQRFLPSHYT